MASFAALYWLALALPALAAPTGNGCNGKPSTKVQLGPRPYWLVDVMEDGPLKAKLASCGNMNMRPTAWSIGHRGGGTLQFPEETTDSILAGVEFTRYPPLWGTSLRL
jgi:glycerophosphoryl diester phosphodiesterase